jgi:hypothetical protein
MPPVFIQVTVSPTAIVKLDGLNEFATVLTT